MARKLKVFIAGTDTDVGKTLISCAILQAAQKQHLTTMGLKPVAAGGEQTAEGLRNEDALQLQALSSVKLAYEQVNPICLTQPLSPHIAAERDQRQVHVARITGFCRGAMMMPADVTVVEGAGGWRVPLNSKQTMAHLAQELNLPVILVVGMRLGCLNHAMLTVEAMQRDGVRVLGWIATRCEEHMAAYDENVQSLDYFLPFPLLAEIPYLTDVSADVAANYIDIDKLFETAFI